MLQYFSSSKGETNQKYGSEDFLFRWKKLERIIQKQNLDGLLLVTGADGSQHLQNVYLFNWLMLGLSGKSIYNNKYLDPIYSQIIIIIGVQQSFVFITPEAKKNLDHLIYTIPNCNVFSPTGLEYANKEILDTVKITYFYQAVNKLKKIGVNLNLEENVKSIEKWPIIQSFALQPVGGTFFTLKYSLTNLNIKIIPLFKNLDKHSLKNLVSQTAYSMEGHIKGTTSMIEITKINQRSNISESQLQESLNEAVDIDISSETVDISSELSEKMQKYEAKTKNRNKVNILFGCRTSLYQTQNSSKAATIQHQKAFHMTIEHYDPYTKIEVWRTYFLDLNIKKHDTVCTRQVQSTESFLVSTKYGIQQSINERFDDNGLILNLYFSLVQGLIDAISTISKDYRNLNKQFLSNHIYQKISSHLNNIYKQQTHTPKKEDLQIIIQSYDSMGDDRVIDFKDSVTFKLTSTFYVVKCRLNKISSFTNNNISLGSIVFSEAFLLQEGCYLLLTKNVQYFDFWKCTHQNNAILDKLNPNYQFQQLGPLLNNEGFKNRLFIPLERSTNFHFSIPVLDVRYYFHEKGLRIFNEKTGWLLLLYSQISDASMINKIPGEWVLLKIKQSLLFEHYESNIIAIQFRGKAFEMLLKKINNKANPLHLNFLDVIPPLLSENSCFSKLILKKQYKEGVFIHQHQILHHDFLWSFIQAKQLMILNQMKDIKLPAFRTLYHQKIDKHIVGQDTTNHTKAQENNSNKPLEKFKHQLLVINGTYGSNKLKLAETISKFGSNAFNYSIFHIKSTNLYSRISHTTFIQMLEQFISDNKIQPISTNIIILIIPSWLNNNEILPLLSEGYHIRASICKICMNNFYMNKNSNLVQNVLTYGLAGYAQYVILDSQGESQNEIDQVVRILWNYNKENKISRASNSMISTGLCNQIVKDISYHSQYQTFLRSKYGALYKFDQIAQLSVNFMEFKFPLYDLPAVKALQLNNGYLIYPKHIQDELKLKKEEAINSKDQLMMALYLLEESVLISKKKQYCTQIKNIKAIVRVQNEKELTQIAWTNGFYKQKNITLNEENLILGFYILSKNYNELQVKQFLQNLSYKKFAFEGLRKIRQESSITEEERTVIWKEGRDKYLENGEFYDGSFFRDNQGHILPEHPNLNKLKKQWINNENQQIQQANQKIRNQWNAYAKQYM